MSRHPIFLFALLPLLSACAINSGNGDAPASAEMTAPSANDPATATTTSAPAPKAAAKTEKTEAKLEGPAPETLVGKDGPAITQLVGTPALVRHEKGVEVWQYTDDSCVLLMYFYDDKAGGARKLTYMEALTRPKADPAAVTPTSCLASQIHAFKTKPVG